MAFLQGFDSIEDVGERTGRAFRLPVGAISPLWAVFGAAASAAAAYWWMTQWTRAVNVEALAAVPPVDAPPAPRAPIAIVAETDAEPASFTVETEAVAPAPEAAEAAEEAAPVAAADDLTRMVGIGPKLLEALAVRGVTRFAQIAAWTDADLAEVDEALKLKGRAVREAWVAQARRFAAEA